MKLLEGNIKCLHELWIRKDILRHKYPCHKRKKMINFTTLKLETSFLKRHYKDRRQAIKWEKILAAHITYRGH